MEIIIHIKITKIKIEIEINNINRITLSRVKTIHIPRITVISNSNSNSIILETTIKDNSIIIIMVTEINKITKAITRIKEDIIILVIIILIRIIINNNIGNKTRKCIIKEEMKDTTETLKIIKISLIIRIKVHIIIILIKAS